MYKKILIILSSFLTMLCLGSIYAFSIFVPYFKELYNYSTFKTQLIFGTHIMIFAITMLFVEKFEKKYGNSNIIRLSAFFFGLGYLLAYFSNGNFITAYLGIGIISAIGTGLGYFESLITPVKCYPNHKGLVTGISASGFALGSVVLTLITKKLFSLNFHLLEVFLFISITYFLVIFISSFLMDLKLNEKTIENQQNNIKLNILNSNFYKLFIGIFCGSFAGLLIIGNLKPIGKIYMLSDKIIIIALSAFALFNFLGRIIWGILSDSLGGNICILSSLILQAICMLSLGLVNLNDTSYVLLTKFIAFSFGANFVLYAKETAQIYGVDNVGKIYPYVFLGYVSGIFGPATGGYIYDKFGNYTYAMYISAILCLIGAISYIILNFKTSFKSS